MEWNGNATAICSVQIFVVCQTIQYTDTRTLKASELDVFHTSTIKTELYSYGISILILCEWYFFFSVCSFQSLDFILYNNNKIESEWNETNTYMRETERRKKKNNIIFFFHRRSIWFHLVSTCNEPSFVQPSFHANSIINVYFLYTITNALVCNWYN